MSVKKIVINGFFLTRPFTGIGTYTQSLISLLASTYPRAKGIVLVPSKVDFKLPTRWKYEQVSYPSLPTLSLKKFWWEHAVVPKVVAKHQPDIFHIPYPAVPLKYSLIPESTKVITTVHDTIPWEDNRYQSSLRAKISQAIAKRMTVKADRVLVVSEASKRAVFALLPTVRKKLFVVPNVLSKQKKSSNTGKRNTLTKLAIKEPFLLYVGGYDVRKNIDNLLEAFKLFSPRNKKYQLVLTGSSYTHRECIKEWQQKYADLPIVWTGFLEEEMLTRLYKYAHGFVHVSSQEGFNLPLLEAASHRLPIVTSDIPIHHEVVGAGAIFVDHTDAYDIAKNIEHMVRMSDHERYELSRTAWQSIQRYQPKEVAAALHEAYN